MAEGLRRQVVSVYRHILRAGRRWEALEPAHTQEERQYILTEAQALFRANQHLTDPAAIRERLVEAESRLEIALHYRTPYPRPVNMPPLTITKSWGKRNLQKQKRARPVYVKSLDTEPT
ncbi:LYR motif-containing protein 1-like isoform X2 [Portunus trituberculatus]|nr:LYR motif-containing protein 1-like isoform X2 [Portunus trituberculatus]XP_045134104.1 LYR motif-containing protein 1-like isoform X2 [Portunus trituberculatus]